MVKSLSYAYIKPWDEALDPFVLSLHDQIFGFFYISYTTHITTITGLVDFQIDEKYQGKGYGKKGMAEIIQFLKKFIQTAT